ncbi:MAG: bifunctional (p)ppGpp synthetase/guanosine-3',5'-bis(diphosphate) 3'-pyrophosphohydrolase [Cytophagales bacterium]|nr:MAG: bifunctional (p)ppGpp synthetase/guanosine-3',5'-bis(diphosphate) 3'-pyrophosphohydrolase [Cytophagales bacterium]
MYQIELYRDCLAFAAFAHQKQMMPGSNLPYLLHLTEVAAEVICVMPLRPDLDSDLLVSCAVLHDVLEDTSVAFATLAEQFGRATAEGVQALSKNATLPKDAQMEDSLSRILAQPTEVAIVKMADRIVNLKEPPHYWTIDKRKSYQEEARLIHRQLKKADVYMAERLENKIIMYEKYLS